MLECNLVPEVNEYFLFHGTCAKMIKIIMKQGADPRVCASNYFGKGVYFAESSTKSDQYTG